jgi:hypothetical protein
MFPGVGSGFMVPGSWFRVHGSRFMVPGSWFRVHGSGLKIVSSKFNQIYLRISNPEP